MTMATSGPRAISEVVHISFGRAFTRESPGRSTGDHQLDTEPGTGPGECIDQDLGVVASRDVADNHVHRLIGNTRPVEIRLLRSQRRYDRCKAVFQPVRKPTRP